ncbi:Putative diacylglycerol O-acyltransferase [bacterium HR30]|nr:Putative diacylglycerol O-acyltransferase [bacterium HR30]
MSTVSQRLSNLEALFFALDQPGAPVQLAWLCRLADRLPLTALRTHVAQRLDRIPHSRERVEAASSLRSPAWTWDDHFSLSRHVKLVPANATKLDEILQVCCRLLEVSWDARHPFWNVWLIQPARGSSSILVRAHRGILPFENEAELLNAILDPQPTLTNATRPRRAPATVPLLETQPREVTLTPSLTSISRVLRDPYLAVERLRTYSESFISGLRAALTPPPALGSLNGPLSHHIGVDAVEFELNEVRQIRNRVGGSILEIVLSSIVGGLSRALSDHQSGPSTPELFACVPLTTGSEQDAHRTGTRATFAIARLPLTTSDPIQRLRRVSAELDLLRATQVPEQYRRTLDLMRGAPYAAFRACLSLLPRTASVHTICLELPSIRERRYVAGREVTQIVAIPPLLLDIRVTFAVQTYAARISVGISVDSNSRLSASRVARAIRAAQRELLEYAGLA